MADQVVVITGASGGIGAATAELLATQGHSVVIVARRADALAEVAARCHGRAYAVQADCTVRDDVRRVAAEAIAKFGHVDVWMNNVGQGISRQPTELTDGDATGRTKSVSFDTSAGATTLAPADAPSFTGMKLQLQ